MSAFVTDTHPLIWYTSGKHSRLSKRAARFFDQAFAERALLVIPAPVLWEIALLIEHGKVKTAREPFEHWAASLTSRKGVDFVSLDLDVIAEAHRLTFHGDPFDRTIVATARLMNLPLITKDEIIVNSRLVETAW